MASGKTNFSDPIDAALMGRDAAPTKIKFDDIPVREPKKPAPAKIKEEKSKEKANPEEKSAEPKAEKPKTESAPKTAPQKKSVGRPKVDESVKKMYKISVVLSADTNEKLATYKAALGGSISGYVDALIKADMEKNEASYKQISDIMKKMSAK